MNPTLLGGCPGAPSFSIFNFSDSDKNSLPFRVVQERKEKEAAMELPLSFKSGDKVVAAPIARRLAVLKARTARALPCAGCAGNTDKSKSWDCPAFRVQGSAFFPPHILPVKDTQSAATLAL